MGLRNGDVALRVVADTGIVPPDQCCNGMVVVVDMALKLFALLRDASTLQSTLVSKMCDLLRRYYSQGTIVVVLTCDVSKLVTAAKQATQRGRTSASGLASMTAEEFATLHRVIPQAGRLRPLSPGQDARGTVMQDLYDALRVAFDEGKLTQYAPHSEDCVLVLDGGLEHSTTVLTRGANDMLDLPDCIPPVGEADLRIGAFVRYFLWRASQFRQTEPARCAEDRFFGWPTINVYSADTDMILILSLLLISDRDWFAPTAHLRWEQAQGSQRTIAEYLRDIASLLVRPTFGPVFLVGNKGVTWDVTRIAEQMCLAAGGGSPLEYAFVCHLLGSDFVSCSWAQANVAAIAAPKRIAGQTVAYARALQMCSGSVDDFARVVRAHAFRRIIEDFIAPGGQWTVQVNLDALAAELVRIDRLANVGRTGRPIKGRTALNVDAALVSASNALFAVIMQTNGTRVNPANPKQPNHPDAQERQSGLSVWGWETENASDGDKLMQAAASSATAQGLSCAGPVVFASKTLMSQRKGLYPPPRADGE